MFECRLNQFLVEILQEYNAALGLNNPPPTAQLLNAMASFVKQNTIKNIGLLFDVNSKELTVKATYNDNRFAETKVDLSSIGGSLDVYDLVEKLEGSETVVVDINEAGNKVEIHLDSEVVAKIERALLIPVSAPTSLEFVAVDKTKQQRGISLSADFYVEDRVLINSIKRINVTVENARIPSGGEYSATDVTFSLFMHIGSFNIIRDDAIEIIRAALNHPSCSWYEDHDSVYFTPLSYADNGNYININFYNQQRGLFSSIRIDELATLGDIEIE